MDPHVDLQDHPAHAHHLWMPQPTSTISESLYRLRVSVLKDNEGQGDCPTQIFAFKNRASLQDASNMVAGTFGASFSGYTVKNLGFEPPEMGEENVEDGRTQALTIEFDSIDANESWEEFLKRLVLAKNGWVKDIGSN